MQNDILCEIDNQKCVILLLLDMSAAFNTVDHKLLLERMEKRYGVKGNALIPLTLSDAIFRFIVLQGIEKFSFGYFA